MKEFASLGVGTLKGEGGGGGGGGRRGTFTKIACCQNFTRDGQAGPGHPGRGGRHERTGLQKGVVGGVCRGF